MLCGPNFGILERKVVEAHGGTSAADASSSDKATNWLNQNSAGAGAFTLVGWTRNAQILLTRNPHYWRGPAHFEHVVIRHMGESATQLLAVKRGDIDAAFNLIPEQIATLKGNPDVRVEGLESLDFVYMALTCEPAFNKALAVKEARQAVWYAIDYDGIINDLLGGHAIRCASFIPIGLYGSTRETTKEIGYHQDLEKSKQLLAKAGFPDGFEYKLSYGDAAVSGLSYAVLGQKLQSDLARVGIKVVLDPMDQVNLRTQYTTGKSTAVLTFWNPSGVEEDGWTSATVERVAETNPLDPAGGDQETGAGGRSGDRSAEAGGHLSAIFEVHDRPGQPDHPVPADLPVRGTKCDQKIPADRGGVGGADGPGGGMIYPEIRGILGISRAGLVWRLRAKSSLTRLPAEVGYSSGPNGRRNLNPLPPG